MANSRRSWGFYSPDGNLVPVAPGTHARPFDFILWNTPNLIGYGAVTHLVAIDGSLQLYGGVESAPADIMAVGGGPGAGVDIPYLVPEPSTSVLAVMGFLFAVGQRRRTTVIAEIN